MWIFPFSDKMKPKGISMKEKEMRFRVSENLYKRYKLLCVEKELSIPKQTAALIKNFVEIQEENNHRIKQGN